MKKYEPIIEANYVPELSSIILREKLIKITDRNIINNVKINIINSDIRCHINDIFYYTKDYDIKFGERVYKIINDMETPICPICKTTKLGFQSFNVGYKKTCSVLCGRMFGEEQRSVTHQLSRKKNIISDIIGTKIHLKIHLKILLESTPYILLKKYRKFLIDLIKNESNIEIIKNNLEIYSNKEPNQKKLHTLENFQLRYGEECGSEKYLQYLDRDFIEGAKKCSYTKKSKSPSNKEYYLKLGFDNETAEIKVNEYCKTNRISKWVAKTRAEFYGEDIKSYNRSQSTLCKEYWLFENHISNGKILTSDEIDKKVEESIEPCINNTTFLNASKESLTIFLPIISLLIENKIIDYKDYYIGYEDKVEYFLISSGKYYSYDFTIPSLSVIIEYNGSIWHPRKDRMTELEFENFIMVHSKMTPCEKEEYDLKKNNAAKSKGFSVLEIWDTDSVEYNIDLCKNFIMDTISNDK